MTMHAGRRALLTLLATSLLSACGDRPTDPFRFQQVVVTPSGTFPGGRGAVTRFEAAVVNTLSPRVAASRNLSITNTNNSGSAAVVWLNSTFSADGRNCALSLKFVR